MPSIYSYGGISVIITNVLNREQIGRVPIYGWDWLLFEIALDCQDKRCNL